MPIATGRMIVDGDIPRINNETGVCVLHETIHINF